MDFREGLGKTLGEKLKTEQKKMKPKARITEEHGGRPNMKKKILDPFRGGKESWGGGLVKGCTGWD